jgi:hypothetical protein
MSKIIANKLIEIRQCYKIIVKDILSVRNKILVAMEKFNNANNEMGSKIGLDQLGKLIECTRSIRSKYKVDIFSTLDIERVKLFLRFL